MVVAIAVLAVVFVGSLIALIVLCVHRFRHRDTMFKQLNDSRPDLNLIKEHGINNMELDDVQIHPEIDKILSNAQWVDDATGLIPHCLTILKSCHHLTERLVGATMSLLPRYQEEDQQKKLWEIIRVAQAISPRVDDVVQSMYPPLDPRLLEARCMSLVLSVTQLSLVIKFLCHIKSCWIEESVDELHSQIRVLRDAGHVVLNSCAFTGGVVNAGCAVTELDDHTTTTVPPHPGGTVTPAAASSSFADTAGAGHPS